MTRLDLQIPALLEAYRTRQLTPSAMVRLLDAKIAARGADAVWIERVPLEALLAGAAALEARGPSELPLHGVPFAVKDNIDVEGLPTTAGCPAYGYRPAGSAPVVAALEAAGAICLGKTNLDQFATGLVGTRSPYGAPRSVFDARYISGGSSSGSAVAVAAGLASFALGTDTAGSGRVPAAFNNIVGLKPSRGLISTRGVLPACRSLDCVSVFALTAGDAWAVTRIAMGHDKDDPFSRAIDARPLDIATPTLGVLKPEAQEFFGDADAQALYVKAIADAEALGARIVPIDYGLFAEAARLLYGGPFVAERFAAVGAFLRQRGDEADPTVRAIIEAGADLSAADLFAAEHKLAALKASVDTLWPTLDALLLPTAPTTYTVEAITAEPIALNAKLGTYTNFVNLLDCAAIAVPAGFGPNGLPFGVSLIGPCHADADLVRIADRLHRASPSGTGATRATPDLRSRLAPTEPREDGRAHLAVVGAHLSGEPLNGQLTRRGAKLVRTTRTASDYRFYALRGTEPPKPALQRSPGFAGQGIEVEVWALSLSALGALLTEIPPPLGLGTLTLADGTTVQGFIVEPFGLDDAVDITAFGGWRAYRRATPQQKG